MPRTGKMQHIVEICKQRCSCGSAPHASDMASHQFVRLTPGECGLVSVEKLEKCNPTERMMPHTSVQCYVPGLNQRSTDLSQRI